MNALFRFLRGYRACRRMLRSVDPQLVQPFQMQSDRLVEREQRLLLLASGKRVVHFGFLDSIFLERKLADGSLLHSRLASEASELYGVDINGPLLDQYRAVTGDSCNLIWDIADGSIPQQLQQPFDLILFPEVLEHVPNPGLVLANLAALCRCTGANLCLTVPNAFDMYNFMAAMHGVELIHPEHCYTFTPYSLSRLLQLAGFNPPELEFYNFGSALAPGITKAGMLAVCSLQDMPDR